MSYVLHIYRMTYKYISKVEYLSQPIGSEEMRKFYCPDCTSFQSKASLL